MEEFKARRARLLNALPADSVVLLPSASHKVRNRDAEYPFRQDSDFFYLTGFKEDNALLVLSNKQGKQACVLFCQAKNPEMELWTGKRLGIEAAPAQLGVDSALDITSLDEKLVDFIADSQHFYACWGKDEHWDKRFLAALGQVKNMARKGVAAPQHMDALEPVLHNMRLFKDTHELARMRKAAAISAKAHTLTMQACQPGKAEYELESVFIGHCLQQGARFQAYNPIVGAGENACILHYNDNDQPIAAGDLILIDAGCEWDHYASDITRTFPASGKFSAEQKALYQICLDAQHAAIAQVAPGKHFNQPHEAAVAVICKGLLQLGLLQGELADIIKNESYKAFYMHRTSHWLGMDVHDVGDYKQAGQWRELQPGMVLTIEPGIYVAPDNMAVDARWRGIGIRIEDDVLVTDAGHEVLTAAVVKSVADIETLMASHV